MGASQNRRSIPLVVQIVCALAIGCLLGFQFGKEPFLDGTHLGNASLGRLASLITTLFKTLAGPLVFCAVLDAFVRTEVTWERGRKLLGFSLLNVCVAMAIGLAVMNLFRPGDAWAGRFASLAPTPSKSASAAPATPASNSGEGELSSALVDSLARMIPSSILQPLIEGNLMAIILFAVLLGAAYRSLRNESSSMAGHARVVEACIEAAYMVLLRVLEWVVKLAPVAVLGAVAQSVSETGLDVFRLVAIFLAAMLAGLTLHAFGYYTLMAWWYGGKPPRVYLGKGSEAMLTGLSTNSSLATVPVTLRALVQGMGVSDQSARLSACVGTNFNNDGITLYEAMTAIFLAQAVGMSSSPSAQLQTVAICLIASLGAGGIPQGGLAVLPLVLTSTGLSNEVVGQALPLILTVDWIIARYRSCVNVMGDMVVAIQLDRSQGRTAQ